MRAVLALPEHATGPQRAITRTDQEKLPVQASSGRNEATERAAVLSTRSVADNAPDVSRLRPLNRGTLATGSGAAVMRATSLD
jgi:hypothetical protein